MAKLGSNNLWSKYSLKGRKAKRPFKEVALCKVIISKYWMLFSNILPWLIFALYQFQCGTLNWCVFIVFIKCSVRTQEKFLMSKISLVTIGVSKIPPCAAKSSEICGTRDEKLSKFRRTRGDFGYANMHEWLLAQQISLVCGRPVVLWYVYVNLFLYLCFSTVEACLRVHKDCNELIVEENIAEYLKYAPSKAGGSRFKVQWLLYTESHISKLYIWSDRLC